MVHYLSAVKLLQKSEEPLDLRAVDIFQSQLPVEPERWISFRARKWSLVTELERQQVSLARLFATRLTLALLRISALCLTEFGA
eukprot:4794415-Prymnesium_polylepis.2